MTTVGLSLDTFCRGLLAELRDSCGHEVIALSSPDGHLTSLGEREGVRTIGVAMRRDISPWATCVRSAVWSECYVANAPTCSTP